MEKEYYSIPQILQKSKIKIPQLSRSTVWKWCKDGLLPHLKINRTHYIDMKDYETFISKNIHQHNNN